MAHPQNRKLANWETKNKSVFTRGRDKAKTTFGLQIYQESADPTQALQAPGLYQWKSTTYNKPCDEYYYEQWLILWRYTKSAFR